MALVAWDLHLVVLNHVLLNDSLACAQSRCLSSGQIVEASLGDETIVAWDMRGRLGSSYGQFVMLITLRLSLSWKLCSWIVAIDSNRLLKLCLEVASLGGVGLSWVAPDGSLGDGDVRCHLLFVCLLGISFPVLRCVSQASFAGFGKHLTSLVWVVAGTACVLE